MKKKFIAVFSGRNYLTIEQIINLALDDTARCGYTDVEEAKKHGYTEEEVKKLLKRGECFLKDFIKHGYSEAFPINVCYCLENKTYYLADGQGRRAALILSKELKKELEFDKVPVQLFECPTLNDVHLFIREVNTKRSYRWSSDDVADQDAKVMGGEIAEVRAEVKAYKEELKVKTYYMPSLMFFSTKCSHSKNDEDIHYDRSMYRKYHKTYCEAYANFVQNVSNLVVKSGLMTEKKADGLIRKEAIGILFESYLRFVHKTCEKYGVDEETTKRKIKEASDLIVNFWNDADNLKSSECFRVAMNTDKGAKRDFSNLFNLPKLTKKLFKKIGDIEDIIMDLSDWSTHRDDKKNNRKSYSKVG